jgi:hypothetical protein
MQFFVDHAIGCAVECCVETYQGPSAFPEFTKTKGFSNQQSEKIIKRLDKGVIPPVCC